ncbi:MAG: hypothetical protein ACFB15_04920 [Cyclobacteriaceae bacterium]
MPETPQYRNIVDQQLSKLVEGDLLFKSELVSVYSRYMQDIPEEFAQLINEKDTKGLALLDHNQKTTYQVLALQQLATVFEQTRSTLEDQLYDDEVLDNYVIKVNTICETTLLQLRELQ